jgi:hypothetical protein
MPPSCEQWNRLRSVEYGLSSVAVTGMPYRLQYSIRSERPFRSHSRHGTMHWMFGSKWYAVSSNRTWSLPLPVAPWLRDDRPRDGGAEHVQPLVERVRAEHREQEVPHELLAQVALHVLRGAGLLRLLVEAAHLLALAEVGAEGDDLRLVVLDEPPEDDARVEAAGVGEHDLLHGLGQGKRSCSLCGER